MKPGEPIKSKQMQYTDEDGKIYSLTFSEYKMLESAKEISERTNDLLFKTKRVMKVVAILLIIVIVAVTILYFKLDSMNFMKICYTALS